MNTDTNEKEPARRVKDWSAETDPDHAYTPLPEKSPYPANNRHERRKAAKLMRTK